MKCLNKTSVELKELCTAYTGFIAQCLNKTSVELKETQLRYLRWKTQVSIRLV